MQLDGGGAARGGEEDVAVDRDVAVAPIVGGLGEGCRDLRVGARDGVQLAFVGSGEGGVPMPVEIGAVVAQGPVTA